MKQQDFLVPCSLRTSSAGSSSGTATENSLEKVAIQLNDTHPALAIPELMRLLADENGVSWEQAWSDHPPTFAHPPQTPPPEALGVARPPCSNGCCRATCTSTSPSMSSSCGRHGARYPGEDERIARGDRWSRSAPSAWCGWPTWLPWALAVNGVAELQSRLLTQTTLRDFADLRPEKFRNKTNGVSHRRFLHLANPRLSALISAHTGEGWLNNPDRLRNLEILAEDAQFCASWREVKQANKRELSSYILNTTGVQVDPERLFDVMAKRMVGFKRQLLKVLHVVTLYNRLKGNPSARIIPRTVIFSAKAVPGQIQSNLLIKLIHCVAARLNDDPELENWLKVVFLPDFNVALAQRLFPAADLSEQISLAGREASGTGNMKLAMNGAVTIGTLDGANIELRQWVGAQNFFLFGHTADQAAALRRSGDSRAGTTRSRP